MKSSKIILSSLTVAGLLATAAAGTACAKQSSEPADTKTVSTSHDHECGEGACGTEDGKKDEKKDETKTDGQ